MFKVISTEEKKRKKKWPYALLILFFILLLLIILYSCSRRPSGSVSASTPSSVSSTVSVLEDTSSALPGPASSKSSGDVLAELQKQQVNVTDKVSTEASFSGGSVGSIGTWSVENPSSNSVIMQSEIVLNGKTVAKSVPIFPGQHIDSITLSKQISSGSYSVTAEIKYYNSSTKACLGMADYSIRMTVS